VNDTAEAGGGSGAGAAVAGSREGTGEDGSEVTGHTAAGISNWSLLAHPGELMHSTTSLAGEGHERLHKSCHVQWFFLLLRSILVQASCSSIATQDLLLPADKCCIEFFPLATRRSTRLSVKYIGAPGLSWRAMQLDDITLCEPS